VRASLNSAGKSLTLNLTFNDGTTSQVIQQFTVTDVAHTFAGPWQNVTAVRVSAHTGSGSGGGGGGTAKLMETRINAAGLPRLAPCP
jgi:hypothetical protein